MWDYSFFILPITLIHKFHCPSVWTKGFSKLTTNCLRSESLRLSARREYRLQSVLYRVIWSFWFITWIYGKITFWNSYCQKRPFTGVIKDQLIIYYTKMLKLTVIFIFLDFRNGSMIWVLKRTSALTYFWLFLAKMTFWWFWILNAESALAERKNEQLIAGMKQRATKRKGPS